MAVNEKCDVYSFGVVALETLVGRHPGDLFVITSINIDKEYQIMSSIRPTSSTSK